jgi:peptide-methionine (S)-S-oxide reductase
MDLEKATFAAGCFWGVQYYFDQVPGVINTKVGYTGGQIENPTYEDVCYSSTGHAEALEIEFNPEIISYQKLVTHFFRMHDPTQLNRQGPDIGDQYRSAIFYHDDKQKEIAEKVRDQTQTTVDKPIVSQIVPATKFYDAEEYHQKYSEKTGIGMCHIPYKQL